MKIKINLNYLVKDIAGEEIKPEPSQTVKDASGAIVQHIPEKITNAGKLLGNILVGHNKGDALKYYDWGRTLHKGETIVVDRADFDALIKFIKESDNLSNLTKAQLQLSFKEAEDVAKKEAEETSTSK